MTIQLIALEISKAPSLIDNYKDLYHRYDAINLSNLDSLNFGSIFSELDSLEALHDKLQGDNMSVHNVQKQFNLCKKYVDPNNSDFYFI